MPASLAAEGSIREAEAGVVEALHPPVGCTEEGLAALEGAAQLACLPEEESRAGAAGPSTSDVAAACNFAAQSKAARLFGLAQKASKIVKLKDKAAVSLRVPAAEGRAGVDTTPTIVICAPGQSAKTDSEDEAFGDGGPKSELVRPGFGSKEVQRPRSGSKDSLRPRSSTGGEALRPRSGSKGELALRRQSAESEASEADSPQATAPWPEPRRSSTRGSSTGTSLLASRVRQSIAVPKAGGNSPSKKMRARNPVADTSNGSRWVALFNHLRGDSGIRREQLEQVVELAGFPTARPFFVDKSLELIDYMFNTLELADFIDFLQAYEVIEAEMLMDRRSANSASRRLDIVNFLRGCNAIATEHCLFEMAQDPNIARRFHSSGDHGMRSNPTAELEELKEVLMMIRDRSGLSRSEAAACQRAFRKFDYLKDGCVVAGDLQQCLLWMGYARSCEDIDLITSDLTAGMRGFSEDELFVIIKKVRLDEALIIEECLKDYSFDQGSEDEDEEGEGVDTTPPFLFATVPRRRDDRPAQLQRIQTAQSSVTESPPQLGRAISTNSRAGCSDEMELLMDLLEQLGYRPTRTAVRQAADEASDNQLVMHGSPVAATQHFLDVYRAREGFSSQELSEIDKTFKRYSGNDASLEEGVVCSLEVGKMLRWFGYNPPFEVQQQLIAAVDVDRCGSIDSLEFRKMIRLHRDFSMERAKLMFEEYDSDGIGALSEEQARNALRALGCLAWSGESEDKDPFGFKTSQASPPRLPSRRSNSFLGRSGIELEVFLRSAHRMTEKRRAEFRFNAGFTQQEVETLRHIFFHYDADLSGDICMSEIHKILAEVFPGLASNTHLRHQLSKLVEEVDTNGEGQLDFQDFLRMMRQFYDLQDRNPHAREQDAMQETRFSRTEVEEFREVFELYSGKKKNNAASQSAGIHISQFLRMVQGILPLSNSQTAELCNLFTSVVSKSKVLPGHLVDSSKASESHAGFPEFLILMRALLDMNFGSLEEHTTRIVAEGHVKVKRDIVNFLRRKSQTKGEEGEEEAGEQQPRGEGDGHSDCGVAARHE